MDWTKPLLLADYREIYETHRVRPKQLDEEADWHWYAGPWLRIDAPSAKAYYLLQELDIGPILTDANGELAGIEYIDGPHPGNDYLGVYCNNELSISLLQARLNELDTGLAVRVVED